jgi:PTS system fructose-specific IIA component
MAVEKILDQRIIDLNMKAKNKEEVLSYLAELLKRAGYIDDINGYLQDVYLREQEGITGIGNHVAIPHGKSDSVKQVGIAIGKTDQMIEWESYDGEPSNLFFLFAVPRNSEGTKEHLRLISELAGKLGNGVTLEKLRMAKNYTELTNAFL